MRPLAIEGMKRRDRAFRRVVLRWGRLHARAFPWRSSSDPFEVLIGEVLLQRTRGEHVVAVYEGFLRRWPDPAALAKADVRTIRVVIRPLGLAKRATQLKQLGQRLVDLGGRVPSTSDELLKLPGVGPYGAHAVPIFAFGRESPLVDWVIARLLRRVFGLASGRRPNADPELWALAERLVIPGRSKDLWLGVLDFAAEVCRPRPRCGVCPLTGDCAYFAKMGVPDVGGSG